MTGVALHADTLRKPFLIAAAVLMALVVVIEVGSYVGLKTPAPSFEKIQQTIAQDTSIDEDTRADMLEDLADKQDDLAALENEEPPGLGIPYLGLLDFLLFYGLLLMALSVVVDQGFQGRVQGCLTVILTFFHVIASIVLIILAVLALILMVSLFLAVPFGTIAYLAIFGYFDRGGASLMLGFVLFLKLAMCVCLFVAQPRFLRAKGLNLMIGTSIVANLIVAFLHGFVPIVLVSITDALAAIIVGILALIWGIVMLVGGIVSFVRVLRMS